MAKSASASCKRKRTQNKKKECMDFSVTEMDVAEQLIQLMSADSIAMGDHHQDHTNNNSVEEEEEQCNNEVYAADHLSITNVIFPNNHIEEEDQVFSSGKKRFRSIYDLYYSTKPIYDVVK